MEIFLISLKLNRYDFKSWGGAWLEIEDALHEIYEKLTLKAIKQKQIHKYLRLGLVDSGKKEKMLPVGHTQYTCQKP